MADYLQYGDKGARVKQLQRLLNHNGYHKMRKDLVLDGEFGSLTAAAIQETKYWLGYDKGELRPIAGALLLRFLHSEPLPAAYDERRKFRQAKREKEREAQTSMDKMRLRVLARINGERGELEKPYNTNHIKYNDWWGWGAVPYCMIGISWAWVLERSKAFERGSRWAGCREMLADAKAGGHGIHLTHDPDPGCPGVVDLDGDASPDHAITFVKNNGDGSCTTVEFNTRKNNIGGVWNSRRPLRSCWWFTVEE